MRKYIYYTLLAFGLFSLLFSSVKADTTYDLTSTSFSYLTSIESMKTTADSKLTDLGSDYIGYVIYYKNVNPVTYFALFFKVVPNIRYDLWNNNNIYIIYGSDFQSKWKYSSDFSSLSSATFNYGWPYINTTNGYYVLYSTHDLYPNAGATLNEYVIYNYDGRSYQFYNDGTVHFPSLYELNAFFSTPPDNTPILTSFVSIVLDKLAYICEFLTSSYVYLAIFVILIFYIVIYLFRGLL